MSVILLHTYLRKKHIFQETCKAHVPWKTSKKRGFESRYMKIYIRFLKKVKKNHFLFILPCTFIGRTFSKRKASYVRTRIEWLVKEKQWSEPPFCTRHESQLNLNAFYRTSSYFSGDAICLYFLVNQILIQTVFQVIYYKLTLFQVQYIQQGRQKEPSVITFCLTHFVQFSFRDIAVQWKNSTSRCIFDFDLELITVVFTRCAAAATFISIST